ncbi:hypothetical protein EHS25_007257 [Saitozyma podzolica]|uniref:HD domain-containing protein n=1 Tax=Saitozyma podzolica TaxID=1890683 RepID=A0A427XN26_9TREE|nr:hypothetical protein EHS25_007257 [Saitozyma podzolica]
MTRQQAAAPSSSSLDMSLNIPYPLSPTQVESFHRDGYLLIADALSPSDIQDMQAWSAEVKAWPNRVGEHMPYEEQRADGSTGLCRTESKCFTDRVRLMTDYANYHDGFGRLFRGDKLTGILTELMGEQAVLFKEKINYKEAGGSGGFDAHIDANAYNHAGAVKHLTFLIAVNDMDMSNGCLEVVQGSHKEEVPLAANKCIEPAWEAKHTWVPVPMPAGSLLVFGSYLAHRSGPNSSPKPRAAIYATYNGISEGDKHDAYYAHRRKAWPPTFERVPGVDYTEGAITYAFGSPMTGGKEAIDRQIKSAKTSETIDQLFNLLKAQGDRGYIGENISQLEHSLQAAESAQREGADTGTVVAALLHDVGQFLPYSTAQDMISNGISVGRKSHEAVGAAYLRELGFPKKVCELVGAHVVAKRYLTATEPGYHADLSAASQASLKHQGGPFSPDEVLAFKQDPLWKEKVALRRYDDSAKLEQWEGPGLDSYKPLVEQLLAKA